MADLYPILTCSPKLSQAELESRSSFEPVRLGGATGRGAKPLVERSAPSRCVARALAAKTAGGSLPSRPCGLTVF